MRYYICDKRSNSKGYHVVHTISCPTRPSEKYRKNVGKFGNCKLAVQSLYAMNKGNSFKFIGCHLCCRPCSR